MMKNSRLEKTLLPKIQLELGSRLVHLADSKRKIYVLTGISETDKDWIVAHVRNPEGNINSFPLYAMARADCDVFSSDFGVIGAYAKPDQ